MSEQFPEQQTEGIDESSLPGALFAAIGKSAVRISVGPSTAENIEEKFGSLPENVFIKDLTEN